MKKTYFLAAAVMAAFSLGGAASAATCANTGVTLSEVDGNPFSPVNASACFGAVTGGSAGNLDPSEVQDALDNNDWGFGVFDWVYLGKDETGTSTGSVQADVGSSIGDWFADFGAGNKASVFVVLLKAGNGYSSFKFDIAPDSGQTFAGGFNTQLAGLENAGLSHLEVAGVYTGMTPVPLPAAGWMLVAGLGGLAAMRRRRKS